MQTLEHLKYPLEVRRIDPNPVVRNPDSHIEPARRAVTATRGLRLVLNLTALLTRF